MRSRIYIAATAIITIAVVGWAAAQEAPSAPAPAAAPAPAVATPQQRGVQSTAPTSMVRTPNERGVVSEEQRDQPGQTLEQRQLATELNGQDPNGLAGATLQERQVAAQRGISLQERGLGADSLTGQPLDATLPEVGVAQAGEVPLMVDPNGTPATAAGAGVTSRTPSAGTRTPSATTGTASSAAGTPSFTTGAQRNGGPAVIVIMPSPTTATGNTSTGNTFIDPSTSATPLFEASQQARRESSGR